MDKSIKFRVSGRVQGVFFRASAKQEAERLGLQGWIRNCAHGEVEGVASGSAERLEAFARWLARGPRMARVEKLEVTACEYCACDAFSVR